MIRSAAIGALLVVLGTGSAVAETMLWQFSSEYPYRAQIEFYSQDRPYSWPGNGQAYNLDDYQTYTYELECQSGEQICYGAWVTGEGETYWGTGPDDSYSCEDCCAYCGDEVVPVTLSE